MKTKVVVVMICLVLVVGLGVSKVQGANLTGKEIVDRSQTLEQVEDMKAEMEMRIIAKSGRDRLRKLKYVSKKYANGVEKSLIRFLSPADVRGTGFLSIDHPDKTDEQYLYLPALGRPRRISSDQRGGSFMGSDFTYEDISINLVDYTYQLVATKEIAGEEVYVVEARPVSESVREDVGFAKRIIWIRTDNFTVVKAQYFDQAGTKIKVMQADQVKEIASDCWLATKMVMRDLEKSSQTVLVYQNVEVNTGIRDRYFSIRQLTRPGL